MYIFNGPIALITIRRARCMLHYLTKVVQPAKFTIMLCKVDRVYQKKTLHNWLLQVTLRITLYRCIAHSQVFRQLVILYPSLLMSIQDVCM